MPITLSLYDLTNLAKIALVSALAALLISPLGIWLARKLGLIDYPKTEMHKQHRKPTPMAGGLILAICLPALLLIFRIDNQELWGLMQGAAIILIFGLLDDRFSLNATLKLGGQFLGSFVLVSNGITVHFLDSFQVFAGEAIINPLQILITILWVMGITNAFNLTDSMDGLTAGLSIISASSFAVFSLAAGQIHLAQICTLLFGLAISLYALNMTPALSFLGDSGAQVLGFLLAGIAILYTPYQLPQSTTWFAPILLLAMPIFDTCLVIFSRIRNKTPIFKADLGHTYHRLVLLGLAPAKAVFLIQITAFLLCISGFILTSFSALLANVTFLFLVILGWIAIYILETCTTIKQKN